MQKTSSVTKSQIMGAIAQLNGCAIGAITTVTIPTLTGGKSNPMQSRVTKKMVAGNVMFFCNNNSNGYQNMVKKRLAAEGKDPESFVLGALPWGERVAGTPFIVNKGEMYIQVIFLNSPKNVTYFLDGNEIDKKDVQGLKLDKEEGEQGGLDKKVIIRTFKLGSVKGLKMGALTVEAM
jgi:hypothetical protein